MDKHEVFTIWKKGNTKISGKFEEWKVQKCGMKFENVRKIRKMKNDNRNKRGNTLGGDKCKNPQKSTIVSIY